MKQRRLWIRVVLGYLALNTVQLGVWALFAPQSFYDSFPGMGRSFISVDGPFNEHLLRDFGALNLALFVLLVAAAIRMSRELIVVAALSSLTWGVPHFIYHMVNTDGLSNGDLVISLGALALFAALPISLLVMSRGNEDLVTV